jgi:copper chaperone CopZ
MRLVVLALLSTAGLFAEFLEVRLEVPNMDCASCVQSLQTGLKRIRGVEKVSVGPQSSVEFTLQPGNKVTLERLRDAIKGVGFTPNLAHVTARGKAITNDGKWRFEVDGIAKSYNLTAASNDTVRALRAQDGQTITVKATSPPPPDPQTMPTLAVNAVVEQR